MSAIRNMTEENDWLTYLAGCKDLFIYGAGSYAYATARALQDRLHRTHTAYVVSDSHGNSANLAGTVVITVADLIQRRKKNAIILLAVPEEYQAEIVEKLQALGIGNYICLDATKRHQLWGGYIRRKYSARLVGVNPESVSIYMAVSHGDKRLLHSYEEPTYIKKIQVGVALTEARLAALTDLDTGLSEQNLLYGELNATYYAWQKDRSAIKGMYHYRRILALGATDLSLLQDGIYDAILPDPFICYPDTSGQFGRYLNPRDIEIMRQVLLENDPVCAKKAEKILKGELLYNYNIVVARAEIFDVYASWIFPLLAEITKRCEAEPQERLSRYIGRIGEVLTSIYFMANAETIKTAHAELIWRA